MSLVVPTTNNTHVPVVYTNWADLMRDATPDNLPVYVTEMEKYLRNACLDYSKMGWCYIKSSELSGRFDFWQFVDKYWQDIDWRYPSNRTLAMTENQRRAEGIVYVTREQNDSIGNIKGRLRSIYEESRVIYEQKPWYQKIIIFFKNLPYLRLSWGTVNPWIWRK